MEPPKYGPLGIPAEGTALAADGGPYKGESTCSLTGEENPIAECFATVWLQVADALR